MREMSGYHDTANERLTDSNGHTMYKTKDTLTWTNSYTQEHKYLECR